MRKFVLPALLAASIPATAVLAQTQAPAQPQDRPSLSPEAKARLLDGRFAMIKEALKLNDAQLKLWAPVEQHMRTSFADRQKARAERREKREQQGAQRPALPDRLDRASERMAKRAERMKAFAEVMRPFYASLTDDQKAVANVVLRAGRGDGGFGGRRWTMNRQPGPEQK
jgi:LTXXQ motif family protein